MGVALVFAMLFLVLLMILAGSLGGRFAMGAVVLWIAMLFGMFTTLERLPRKRRRVPSGSLLTDQCLCCGYELEGLKPEDDGCVVCPECGAAWRYANAT